MPEPTDPIDPRDTYTDRHGTIHQGLMRSSSPMEMTPPRRRKELPEQPLECPSCGSDRVDEAARVCLACDIGLPIGAPTRRPRRYIQPRKMRAESASNHQGNQRALNEPYWRR